MKTLLKDKAFLVCAVVFLLALGKIIHNRLPNFNSESKQAGSTYREELWKKADARPKETYSPVPSIPLSRTYSGRSDLPVRKSRPKLNNVWVVGHSEKADSTNIEAVMMNLVEGDSLTLEAGEHQLKLETLPRNFNIKISGSVGTVLTFIDGSVRNFKTVTFENMKINVNLKDGSKTIYLGDGESVFNFINTEIQGNDRRFYLSDKVVANFNKTRVFNTEFMTNERVKVFFEDCEIKNEMGTFISMDELSEVSLKNTKIDGFGQYGFYFYTQKSSLKLENVTLKNGDSIFGGSYLNSQITSIGFEYENIQSNVVYSP